VRRLGRFGPRVGGLGLGLAALGRPGYVNVGHDADLGEDRSPEALLARTHAVLDAAWEAGVRYFDAARSYGRAEEFLAAWIRTRGVAPDQLLVGSKWGYTYTAGWRVDAPVHEVKDHSLPVLRRQWMESRELLGPHLRLYQIHSATLSSGVLDDISVLDELARLKEAHGIRVGLSVSGPDQRETVLRALEIERDDRPLFDTVQATWNLLEPSCGIALAEARAAGRGVIVKEALANGRLTARNRDPELARSLAALQEQAKRLNAPVEAVAIAAALAQPFADVVLSGAATLDHLRANLRALDTTWDDEAAERLAHLPEQPEAYWARRRALPWT
jgi:aryl-alcohol dehydrogenase-like predicted oxidoreductase